TLDKELAQCLDDVCRLQLPRHTDGDRFACELVDDAEHAECLSIVRAVGDEVVGPHMVGVLRSQTDAGSVVEPQTPAFGLPGRYLQPLTPPDALDALLVHRPARPAKQRRDPAVSVTAIL